MQVNHYRMFEVPILIFELDNWTEKKEILVDLYSQQEIVESTESGFTKVITTYQNIFTNPDKHKLLCKEVKLIFAQEFESLKNITGVSKLKLESTWYQKYNKSHEHIVHNHGPIGFSFVCYINYDSGLHNPTTFVSPFSDFLRGESITYSPTVEEGNLIIFPSAILHYAPQNNSDTERLILSGNIRHEN